MRKDGGRKECSHENVVSLNCKKHKELFSSDMKAKVKKQPLGIL